MDENQLAKFRESLLEYKESLLEDSETNEAAAETVELDQTRQGRLSRMDALQGQAMSIAALNRRKKELKKVDQALGRIRENNFGFCEMCDEEIEIKRLEFSPTVTHCIHCAEKLEAD